MVVARRGPTATNMPTFGKMSDVSARGNFLVYSDAGVGKTVFGASSPGGLVIAADKGLISAKQRGSTASQVIVNTWSEFEAVTKKIRAGKWREYDWITVDGLTMLQDMLMTFILEEQHKDNPKQDLWIPAPASHQKVQNMMKHTAKVYCDLPVNVMFTALPMNIETEGGEERVIPHIHGKKGDISNFITGLVDAFGYMSLMENKAGKEVRRIRWKPNGAYIGKDRYGVFAPFTDDITLPQITARIAAAGETTRRTAPTRRRATRRTA